MANKVKKNITITVYGAAGGQVGQYDDVEVLTTLASKALSFKYDEENDDGSVTTTTVTTTLPYFIKEEIAHSGMFSV